jgi:hypothetical protein
MRAGTAVPALPFPAVDTGLTGQKMAGRQAAAAVLCFSEKKKTVSPLSVSLSFYGKWAQKCSRSRMTAP